MNKRAKLLIIFVAAALVAGGLLYINKASVADKNHEKTQQTSHSHDEAHNHSYSDDSSTEPLAGHGDISGAPDAMNLYDIGSQDAPVTIVEYASFSCSHCADFHNNVFDDVKTKLVQTGKARFIFRDFPTNNAAYKATKLAHCVDQSRYIGMVKLLFKNRTNWIESTEMDTTLIQMGRLAGIDDTSYRECQTDEALDQALLERFKEAQEVYQVKATPTFIFISKDGRVEKFSGVRSVEAFETVVDKLSDN